MLGGTSAVVPGAQAAAIQGMTKAGTELAGYVKTLIVGKGAKFVAVVNLPDVGQTPFATGFGPENAAFVSQLATAFNTALTSGLADVPEGTIVDAFALGRSQVANPAAFGLTNVTTPACKTGAGTGNPLGVAATATSFATGPSITCTTASANPNTNNYQFADDVHLTPYGNQLLADFVFNRLNTVGFPN